MFKQKRDPAPDKPRLEPADAVQQARTRARQRLIGAVVLLAIGIIGFPLVFETQPRPIPVDVPIEIPRRDSLPPLAMPPARAPTRPAPSDAARQRADGAGVGRADDRRATRTDAGDAQRRRRHHRVERRCRPRSDPPPRATPTERAASRAVAPASAAEPPRRAASTAVAAAPAAPTAAASPLDGRRRARARAARRRGRWRAPTRQRFVVQVGAFADAEAGARDAQEGREARHEDLHAGRRRRRPASRIRVRVGPFATRGEAEAALAKAKAAGLQRRAAHAVNAGA